LSGAQVNSQDDPVTKHFEDAFSSLQGVDLAAVKGDASGSLAERVAHAQQQKEAEFKETFMVSAAEAAEVKDLGSMIEEMDAKSATLTTEVDTLTKAIEEKLKRVGDIAVEIAQMKNDLTDTEEALLEGLSMDGGNTKGNTGKTLADILAGGQGGGSTGSTATPGSLWAPPDQKKNTTPRSAANGQGQKTNTTPRMALPSPPGARESFHFDPIATLVSVDMPTPAAGARRYSQGQAPSRGPQQGGKKGTCDRFFFCCPSSSIVMPAAVSGPGPAPGPCVPSGKQILGSSGALDEARPM